jgi:uncharacterized membrane protein YkvA (DUF1232 family)
LSFAQPRAGFKLAGMASTTTIVKDRLTDLLNKSGGKKVRKEFMDWVDKAEDLEIVNRGKQLWGYLQSGKVSGFEKAVLAAALLYLITPTDVLPDWIPLVGWMDDLGVAALVVAFITHRLDAFEGGKGKGKKRKGKKRKSAV